MLSGMPHYDDLAVADMIDTDAIHRFPQRIDTPFRGGFIEGDDVELGDDEEDGDVEDEEEEEETSFENPPSQLQQQQPRKPQSLFFCLFFSFSLFRILVSVRVSIVSSII